MAPLPLFRLIQLNGILFITLGLMSTLFPHMPAQAAFFLGSTIPLPRPWMPAPFRYFMTQTGLEESWTLVLNVFRVLGAMDLVFGVALLMQGSELVRQFKLQLQYMAKCSKRGNAVHSKVERYETVIGAARVRYNPPPLWLLALLHVCAVGAAQYACHAKVFGTSFEIAAWFANLVSGVHAVMAIETVACWMLARSLWNAASKDATPKTE